MRTGLHIGTSGWSYWEDWRGIFYHSSTTLFQQYIALFDTSEINSTFYGPLNASLVRHLATTLPEEKFFTAKIPQQVTHSNRLDLKTEAGPILENFFEQMRPMRERLEVLLIQLPPWHIDNMANLEIFFSQLDSDYRYAIEFRHESWLKQSVWNLLEDYGVANVVVDEPRLPIDLRITTDFTYVRWHGHGSNPWYDYLYSMEQLEAWKPRLLDLMERSDTVVGYFNNHFYGYSPLNAFQMMELMKIINPKQKAKLERMLKGMSTMQTSIDDF